MVATTALDIAKTGFNLNKPKITFLIIGHFRAFITAFGHKILFRN